MQRAYLIASVVAIFVLVLLFQFGCAQEEKSNPLSQEEMIALGKYIVHSSACDDCHTPKIFTDKGPVLDTTKLLSGFPQEASLPKVDMNMIGPDKWVMTEKHLGAWVGPWGVSYASNLTPDKATGIGTMTEEMFIKTIRDGKYMGVSRPLLPPMPWEVYRNKTDQDLRAIYVYLMSLKPIHNQVPQPTPPDKIGELASQK